MKRPIIALLTDFGIQDHYVSVMKAVIVQIIPNATLIDICHDVPPQNIRRGAQILCESFKFFPRGTVFICVVDPGVGSSRRAICIKFNSGYLLGPDNGLLSLTANLVRDYVVREIQCEQWFKKPVSSTFHGRDIFAPVAAHLAAGFSFSKVGRKITNITQLTTPRIVRSKGSLKGEITYEDRFGNLISNISRSDLLGKKIMKIQIGSNQIKKLSESFSDGVGKSLMALWNSSGRLELAVSNGSAAKQFKIGPGKEIQIKFL